MSVQTISPEQVFRVPGEIDSLQNQQLVTVRDVIYDPQGATKLEGVGWTESAYYVMSDGTFYEVAHHEPNERSTDVSLWTLPAYGTGINGHNLHNAARLVAAGKPVAQVGPANAVSNKRQREHLPHHPHGLSLQTMARHTHGIIAVATDETSGGNHYYDPEKVVVGGESAGAMVAMVMKALEARLPHRHKQAHTKAVAPVLPRGITLPEIPAEVLQVVRNPITAVHECLELPPSTVWDLLHTFPIGTAYLRTMLGTLPSLVNGEVGRAAAGIELDADMHILTFNHDGWGGKRFWDQIYHRHDRVVVKPSPGSHLSIVNSGLGSRQSLEDLEGVYDRLAV